MRRHLRLRPAVAAAWAVGLVVALLSAGGLAAGTVAGPSSAAPRTAGDARESSGGAAQPIPTVAPAGSVGSWAGTTVATLLPGYNDSLPGNLASTVRDWEVGAPAVVTASGTVWWPTTPVSVGGSPKPMIAPALLYNLSTQAFVGVDRWVTNASAFTFDPLTRLLYATEPLNGTVEVVNVSTGRPTGASYAVGDDPSAIALDPTTRDLYVANAGSNSISVINPLVAGPAGVLWAGIPVGKDPIALAVDATDSWLYVATAGVADVYRLNLSDPSASSLPIVLAEGTPSGIAFSASSGYVAVTTSASADLTIIAGKSGGVEPVTVTVGTGFGAISTNSSGAEFVVANTSGSSLRVVDASSPFTVSPGDTEVQPAPTRLVTVPSTGALLVWSNTSRNVTEVGASGESLASPSGTLGPVPTVIAFSWLTGSVYIGDGALPGVEVLDPYTGRVVLPSIPTASAPLALTINSAGDRLYVGLDGLVQVYNASTGLLVAETTNVSGPCLPLVLAEGDSVLWVGQPARGDIVGVRASDLSTESLSVPIHLSASSPSALAWDPAAGVVLAVNSTSGRVAAFNGSSGALQGTPVAAGANLSALVYDPADDLVYAAGSDLAAVDGSTLSIVGGSSALAPHSHVGGMVYAADRQAIYVATWGPSSFSGSLSVVNASTPASAGTSLTVVPVGFQPGGLAYVTPPQGTAGGAAVESANAGSGTVSVVAASPSIVSAVFTPRSVDVGSPTTLSVVVQGGAGNVTARFTGLPAGCAVPNGLSLTCDPRESGGFTVLVTVRDAIGETATATATLEVASILQVAATVGSTAPPAADVGIPVSMTATAHGGTGPYSYTWSFGNGLAATGPSVSYAYPASGLFVVSVTATDAGGGDAVNATVITVTPLPSAKISVSPATVTDVDLPLTLSANITGGARPGSSLWSFGDGDQATTATADHAWADPGTYPVTYSFTDRLGISSSASPLSITVNPELIATFAVTPASTSPQVGTNFLFSAKPSGGTMPYTAYWTFGDGSSAEGLEVNHSYARAGSYNITVVAVDRAGDAVSSAFDDVPVAGSRSSSSSLFGGGFGPSFALGLLVGGAVASVALFFAERSRRSGPPGPPSAYVPPAPVGRRGRD